MLPVKHQKMDVAQRCAAVSVLERKPSASLALLEWNELRFEAVVSVHFCAPVDRVGARGRFL